MGCVSHAAQAESEELDRAALLHAIVARRCPASAPTDEKAFVVAARGARNADDAHEVLAWQSAGGRDLLLGWRRELRNVDGRAVLEETSLEAVVRDEVPAFDVDVLIEVSCERVLDVDVAFRPVGLERLDDLERFQYMVGIRTFPTSRDRSPHLLHVHRLDPFSEWKRADRRLAE